MRIVTLLSIVLQAVHISADILSIDLGSQFTKVALVSTGKFEIVHNLQSKRKTPTSVSFKSALREFGDDAILASVKNPSKVASFFRWLIGANTTVENSVNLYPKRYVPPFEVTLNETRKSVIFGNEDYGMRTIEETLAHLIWYSKNLVEEHDTVSSGKHKIGSLKELVITVPSWATKRERQAVIDASNIAGFTHVSLVHETSSAVVQRALDLELSRNGTSSINTIYFNMGSSHFEACVINYGLAGNTSNIPTARVLSCAHSLTGGGIEITKKIAETAAATFIKKHPKLAAGFESDLISKIRLFRQAESAKQTLSANKETIFSVESIYEEEDLKQPFFRADIEEFAKPVLVEIEKTIDAAITKAGLTRVDIHQAEVIGGGWRVPCVQSKLESLVDPLPLGQHLNGDESMVFGGAYIAANSSSSYRVRKVVFTDISENEYSLTISPRNPPTEDADKWPKTQTIFPAGQKLGSTKQVKLSSIDSDFDLFVFENGNLIENFFVSGRNETAENGPSIVVKVKLDSDGVFSVIGSDATYEMMIEQEIKIPKTTTTTTTPAATEPEGAEGEFSSTNSTTTTTSAPEYEIQKISVPKKVKIALKMESVQEGYPLAMSEGEKRALKNKLREIVDSENKIKLRTKTKNDLEALIYSLRDKMEDNKRIAAHSTSEERDAVVQVTKTVEEWLDDHGYKADVDTLKEQIEVLRNAVKPIQDRIDEEDKKKREEEEKAEKQRAEELAAKIAAEIEAKRKADEESKKTEEKSEESKTEENVSQNEQNIEPAAEEDTGKDDDSNSVESNQEL